MNENPERGLQTLGFVGTYAYDIILYLARELTLLGKRVLVIDRTIEQEVVRMIHTELSVCLSEGIFHFCGIDITSMVIIGDKDEKKQSRDYDFIIYDFGSNMCPEEYKSCGFLCYVIDMYEHNALRVKRTQEPQKDVLSWTVFRDMFGGKKTSQYYLRILGKPTEKVYQIHMNREDFTARFRMEADQYPKTTLASEEMQILIKDLMMQLSPEFSKKIYKLWTRNCRNRKNSA